MENLKSALPWFVSIMTGMWVVVSFLYVAVNGLQYKEWANVLVDEHIVVFALIVLGLPSLWFLWCLFRRKWAFLGVMMSATIVSVMASLLIIFMLFASLMMA